MGADHSTAQFTALAELASSRVGGRAVATSDDFFASKANLLEPEPAIFIPGKYTTRGKWMDGWESRRRRTPGHDWCVVALGIPGVVHGVNVDTRFFTGNYPSHCSIDAVNAPRASGRVPRATDLRSVPADAPWQTILHESALSGDSDHFFDVDDRRPWTHLRLNIFPDGGVARLRVYGEAAIDWPRIARAGRAIDLASVLNGGVVAGASDVHYGARDNMIMPGRAKNMGDGWETRRRRGPGYDWAIVRLGAPGIISRVEIDTNHYKGNYPESASLEGSLAGQPWVEILPRTTLRAHHRHFFSKELCSQGPISHVRLNIFPDGGISRVRIHGTVAPAE